MSLLTETLPAILWTSEPDGTRVYINKKTVEYNGYTLEMQRKVCVDLVHPRQ
ncbi:MAG TPA: hypothetical protein VKB88_09590 [Bryobacteraceae bacterium]|nr:hypothetical protein [Bryobacteraceae bacterium]